MSDELTDEEWARRCFIWTWAPKLICANPGDPKLAIERIGELYDILLEEYPR